VNVAKSSGPRKLMVKIPQVKALVIRVMLDGTGVSHRLQCWH